MESLNNRQISAFRVAAVFAILGSVIVPFTFISPGGIIDGLSTYNNVLNGAPVKELSDYLTGSLLTKASMYLAMTAMLCILIMGLIFSSQIQQVIWQKYVSLGGYLFGCIGAALVFAQRVSGEYAFLELYMNNNDLRDELLVYLKFQNSHMLLYHEYLVGILIALLGTGFLAWSLLRSKIIPSWFCFTGMGICLLAGLGSFSFLIPSLKYLLAMMPLHFAWLLIMGLFILKKKWSTND